MSICIHGNPPHTNCAICDDHQPSRYAASHTGLIHSMPLPPAVEEAIQAMDEPHIIKGCPRDKWEEVQAIQHEPFIYIKSNGSRWMGDEEGDISELLEVLAKHELDSRMFNHDFITVDPCEGVRDPHVYGKWIDGPRLYECDGVYNFFGNFVDVSHVFDIDTNHKPTIDALLAAIEANKIITVAS